LLFRQHDFPAALVNGGWIQPAARWFRRDLISAVSAGLLLCIRVPAWIGPLPVAKHEHFRSPPRANGPLPVHLRFHEVLCVKDGYVAKSLHLRARKLKPHQLSSIGVELLSLLENLRLMFPFLLACADHDSFRRDETA
jgi:hypothetical protein